MSKEIDARKRIAVLVSGGGSNLQAIINHCEAGNIQGEIVCVISDTQDAYALQRADQHDIKSIFIQRSDFANRDDFEQALLDHLAKHEAEIVLLAGFMRVLSSRFTEAYQGRMLNIHPSLLPAFPGLHTHKRALKEKVTQHGCSVHFVTAELDGGPIVLQACVPVLSDDDEDTLSRRVLDKEHIIYPMCAQWLCEQKISMKNGQAYFNNKLLETPLLLDDLTD